MEVESFYKTRDRLLLLSDQNVIALTPEGVPLTTANREDEMKGLLKMLPSRIRAIGTSCATSLDPRFKAATQLIRDNPEGVDLRGIFDNESLIFRLPFNEQERQRAALMAPRQLRNVVLATFSENNQFVVEFNGLQSWANKQASNLEIAIQQPGGGLEISTGPRALPRINMISLRTIAAVGAIAAVICVASGSTVVIACAGAVSATAAFALGMLYNEIVGEPIPQPEISK